MSALNVSRANLSGAELHRLESLLLDFDQGWDDARLAACARELPANCPWRTAALIEMVKIDLEKQWQRGRKHGRLAEWIVPQRLMGSFQVVVLNILGDEIPQVLLPEHYEMVEAFLL